MSKQVTGWGYLLHFIGLLIAVAGLFIPSGYVVIAGGIIAIIGYLMINIGFITMGRKYGKGAWTATGIIGIIVFILLIAAVAIVAGAFIHALNTGMLTEGFMNAISGAAGLIGIAGILWFVWVIMEIIVLWSAAGYFGSGALKGAAILKIIVLILSIITPIIILAMGIQAALTGSAEGIFALGVVGVALVGIDALLAIIAIILAGIGFLTAKEPTTYAPTYGAQVAPPPPPA